MKKKLESELISIAHRILKLTGRGDLEKMHQEIALLYQKIAVLKFLETHFDGEIPENEATNSSFFSALDGAFNNTVTDAIEVDQKTYVNIDPNEEEDLMEPAIEKIKDIVAQMPQETAVIDDLFEEINKETQVEDDLSALSPSFGQLPIFDPVPETPLNNETDQELDQDLEQKPQPVETATLNDKLKTAGFQIGLNDRLAFVNHLFENNNEDYDRVVSQLNTMDSFEEVTDFIENIIKPDYNNWEGKDDYESRFLEIIEQKFN